MRSASTLVLIALLAARAAFAESPPQHASFDAKTISTLGQQLLTKLSAQYRPEVVAKRVGYVRSMAEEFLRQGRAPIPDEVQRDALESQMEKCRTCGVFERNPQRNPNKRPCVGGSCSAYGDRWNKALSQTLTSPRALLQSRTNLSTRSPSLATRR